MFTVTTDVQVNANSELGARGAVEVALSAGRSNGYLRGGSIVSVRQDVDLDNLTDAERSAVEACLVAFRAGASS